MIWILLLVAFIPNELSIDLDKGWNLISTPLDNPIINENLHYLNNNQYSSTTGQLTFEPGSGYWIFADQPKQIKIQGQITKNTKVQLKVGWNLIGSPILKPIKLSEIKVNNIPITQFSKHPIYTYKNQFIKLNENSIIQPSNSFFVHSTTNTIAEFNTCCQEITNYAVAYNKADIQKINQYDAVIIDQNQYSPEEIQTMNNPICYVSIGEDQESQQPQPWHFYINNEPQINPIFQGYYSNAANPEWQNIILNKYIPELTIKGCKGFFLDTLDTVDLFPESKQGMIDLIKKIRQQYPSHQIIANRGFTITDKIVEDIDAVMFESFTSYYDYNEEKYKVWQGTDLQYTTDIANQLNQLNIKVLALDYSEDPIQMQQNKARADQYNFISYNTNPYLSLS